MCHDLVKLCITQVEINLLVYKLFTNYAKQKSFLFVDIWIELKIKAFSDMFDYSRFNVVWRI